MSEPFLYTDYVRNEFIRGAYSAREMSLEFDRWLDQVKADAWDEGLDAAQRAETLRTYTPDNPYRKQEEA